MEEYERFVDRITGFAKKDFLFERKAFETNLSVFNKVDENNNFRKYYGDTIIFDLKEKDKDTISSIVKKLYKTAPECFCENLNESTFHMTLHDLSSHIEYENIKEQLEKNENKIKEIFKTVKILPNTIKMKTHCIANCLNISLILVLLPANKIEYEKLMTIYHLIDEVKELDYKFTPHITLGYYNINGFDVSSAIKLEKLVREFNQNEFEIDINTKNLFYEHFTSMNNYEKILRICSIGCTNY